MRSWLLLAMPVSLVPLLGLAASLPSVKTKNNANSTANSKPALAQAVWPYLAKNCTACHNATTKAGALDMKSLQNPDSVAHSRETWEAIVRRIQAGDMPPKGLPRPAEADSKAMLLQIENAFDRADHAAPLNPGRVTAHRLNRAEYNNTVHDLLGVNFRPADDFPQDDSGYGFDNNGDVLSLSSSQMEKYVNAAEKIARTAVFGPESLQPTLISLGGLRREVVTSTAIPAHYDPTGMDLPNSLHTSYSFPVDGTYLFRFQLGGERPFGSEPMQLGLWVDGRQVKLLKIDTVGSAAFNLDRQDFAGRTAECRLPVTAGEHTLSATIIKMYEGLPSEYGGPNPSPKHVSPPEFKFPAGIPPERLAAFKKRREERLKQKAPTNDARIYSLEVGGPYAQAKGPSEDSLRKIFTCGHLHGGHNADCARKIVGDLARRAFRRPVTAQEVDRFTSLVSLAQQQGDSFDEGICLAIQGILVSPHFLYRIEKSPAPSVLLTHNISQYELASRLSYFLWSSMPDAELESCADNGTLRKPYVLEQQVRRMLKDPKSHALAENFGGQWLHFRSLESVKPDRKRFPDFDDYLRISMRQETEMFFDSIVQNDSSITDFLLGKYTFLNERLANFYGIPGVVGPDFRRVDLTGTPRGGILTQASVLTVTSYPNRTSPVLRGKWILENILNAPPPPPPPGVPNLDTAAVGSEVSLRKQLEAHRKNPTCASCHARMDPLGFGLENFDAVGAWRTNDGKIAIDSSGSLPDGRTFIGPDGLKSVLKTDQNAFTACLTAKLLTYALGRGLERYDRLTVKEITQHVAARNYRFSSLILEIVNSKPFQMRKEESQK